MPPVTLPRHMNMILVRLEHPLLVVQERRVLIRPSYKYDKMDSEPNFSETIC
jgi:hypothetical protein